jgi:hypothetical protein
MLSLSLLLSCSLALPHSRFTFKKKMKKKIFVKWNLIIQGDQKAVNIFAAKHPNSEVWACQSNQKRSSLIFKNNQINK